MVRPDPTGPILPHSTTRGLELASALTGVAGCARCGTPLSAQTTLLTPTDVCPDCGATLIPPAPASVLGTYSPLAIDLVRASLTRRRIASAIDLAPGIIALVSGLVEGVLGQTAFLYTAAGTVAYLAVQATAYTVSGRTLGRSIMGLRTVDDLTFMPVNLRTVRARLSAAHWTPRTITADLRLGRDPIDGALAPLSPDAMAEGSDHDAALFSLGSAVERGPGESADSVAIVFDTGRRQIVTQSLLIGRSPENSDLGPRTTATHPLLALADLSRTVAKTHVLLQWTGSVLWVTDLQSAHGSTLISPDGDRRTLVPGIRGPAGIGWTVSCGLRTFTVHPVARTGGQA